MRTTLTLDPDVAAALEALQRARQRPYKEIVNDTLRLGLKHLGEPGGRQPPVATRVVDLGSCRLPDVDDIGEVLAIADGETRA
jgi:hypothetical protein